MHGFLALRIITSKESFSFCFVFASVAFFFYCFFSPFFSAVSCAQTPWIRDSLYYCFWGFVVLYGWQIHELLRKLYMGWGSCPPGLLSSFFFIHSLRFIQRKLSCILFFFLYSFPFAPQTFFFPLLHSLYTVLQTGWLSLTVLDLAYLETTMPRLGSSSCTFELTRTHIQKRGKQQITIATTTTKKNKERTASRFFFPLAFYFISWYTTCLLFFFFFFCSISFLRSLQQQRLSYSCAFYYNPFAYLSTFATFSFFFSLFPLPTTARCVSATSFRISLNVFFF